MKGKTKRRSLAAFLAAACLIAGTIPVPAAARTEDLTKVSVAQNGNSITIGNAYISREFSVAGGKLSTTKITNKRTDNADTVFEPAEGSEEFKIRVTKDADAAAPVVPAIDRSGWTATADSYQNATGASNGNAPNLKDGDVDSIWHSAYNTNGTGRKEYPYNVLFYLGKATTFQCFSYTPRNDNSDNGKIKNYELYYSDSATELAIDSDEWQLLKAGSFTYDGSNPIYVNLDEPCTATQIKFKPLSAVGGGNLASGAEFNLHEQAVAAQKVDREFLASELTLADDPIVEDTTATINDVEKTGQKITFEFEPYTFKGVEYTISEVIVMYDGDHFMRKYMEISIPDDKKEETAIDYIDLESLVTNESDAKWTIPTDAGGIVQMERFRANLGQPIYIQGMFFGCEFPAADNEIVENIGYMRYYTGKTFDRLEKDNQLTKDGKYVTWQTVAGAARSTENEVIQADFFDYIKSIATPSEFRIQYNSWFDNMMRISDELILDSFIEVDRELNQVEVRPLDSYVMDDGWINYNNTSIVDAERAGTTLNQTGFWEFNSKFPDGLTPSSELVHKFGSNFGLWVGPRGGYNFYGSLADILTKSGKGSKAGGSIDVADREYVKNFTDMAETWMREYGINYWKWDGFADNAQYNTFTAADGVPGYENHHMTGGYEHMYHVTDLWEAWIDLIEDLRQCEKENDIDKLWISLTCYVNPSPWYLQWANSVWLQCLYDQRDAGSSGSKMDRQMTYRDAVYYDFLKNHEFQFPLSNVYNHDPIYGKEDTGMNINTATDEQFKNYLYMQSTRGTAFWELYFSDSMMTEGKYEITGEFLEWVEENHHILKNAKMIGATPNSGTHLADNSNGTQNAYGYSCFDGTDGIISFRNSATTAKDITVTFDRTIGVPEDAGTLQYHIEHSYNLTEGTPTTGTLTYGQEITYTLQPDEVRILRISKNGDQTAPKLVRAYSDGANGITVKFDEKVTGSSFKVNGTNATVEASPDGITFHLTAAENTLQDKSMVTVEAEDVRDLAGNEAEENTATFRYYKNNSLLYSKGIVTEPSVVLEKEKSLVGNNGFTVSAKVYTKNTGVILSQGKEYEVGINKNGTAYFTFNGTTANTELQINDGLGHTIIGVKENNGMLKIYVDGTLEGAGYNAGNRYYEIKAADIVLGDENFVGSVEVTVADTAKGYDVVEEEFGEPEPEPTPVGEQNWASGKTVTAAWTADGSDAAKGGDRPMSMVVNGVKNSSDDYGEFGADGNAASSYLQVDLGKSRPISKINLYRYWKDGRTYNGTVIALSDTADFAKKEIVYNSDADNFHQLGAGTDSTYAETENGKSITLDTPKRARYVRVYMHGSSGETNHVVELEVIGTEDAQTENPAEADYTAVDMAVAVAEEFLNNADAANYTSDFAALRAAVAAVDKTVSDQAAIDKMATDIFDAIAALEKTLAKKLEDALNKAQKDEEELSGYTADSVAAYNAVLSAAQKVLESTTATDEERADALAQVNAAKDLLEEKKEEGGGEEPGGETDTELEAAKTALSNAITKAATYTDASKYTEGSWAVFQEALKKAKNLQGDETATKDALTKASGELIAAMDKLELVSSTQEPPIEEGKTYDVGDYTYRVTRLSAQTVEVAGIANANLTEIMIPETVQLSGKDYAVTAIGASAFKGNAKVTKATIGKGVTVIGNNAFLKCKNLKTVTLSSTHLTTIGKKAFANCAKIKKIQIKSKQIKSVGNSAFKGLSKKATIKVPAAKRSAYKKLFMKKGKSGKAKIK